MENSTPHTLQDCFAIIDAALSPDDKLTVMNTREFELQYAFHSSLEQWVLTNVVNRYNLHSEDFFYATDLWHQCLLIDEEHTFPTLILLEYRKHLLAD